MLLLMMREKDADGSEEGLLGESCAIRMLMRKFRCDALAGMGRTVSMRRLVGRKMCGIFYPTGILAGYQ